MSLTDPKAAAEVLTAGMGLWIVAAAPCKVCSLLGSCVGVVLYDRNAKVGGVAHIILPDSRGSAEHPGKYADTAIPGMISDLERLIGRGTGRLIARVAGGAKMFQTGNASNIGQMNQAAVQRVLADLRIPVVASDVGGETGRRIVLDTQTGIVSIRIPGGANYTI